MPGISEYLDACNYRSGFLEQQKAWMLTERLEHENDAARLQSELDRVRQEMAGYLIPEITDDYILELEERLSCLGLMEIKQAYGRKFEAAENRQVELESMDEIVNYDSRFQFASQNVEEVRPEYDQALGEIQKWYDSKWFNSLDKNGYFEKDYRAGIFRRFFDWRSVSFLMSHLEKKAGLNFQHPDDLKKHFRAQREKTNKIVERFNERESERNRISGLKNEYEELLSTPERLLADLYRDLGEATIEHLNTCPNQMRLRLASEDKTLNSFLQKNAGLQKQAQYLRELMVARIDSRIQQTDLELDKTDRKIRKLELQRARGKYKRYSDDDLIRMRNVKADKWERRRNKTTKMRKRISDFRKYDRGSCSDDYLWWDLMTNEAPGDDIYEVREHRSRNPDWNFREYNDPWESLEPMAEGSSAFYDDAAEDLAASMIASGDDDLFDPS